MIGHASILLGTKIAHIVPLLRDNTTGTVQGNSIDMQDYDHCDFIVSVGTIDIALNFKVQESVNSDGSSPSDISGAAITALGASDDNKTVVVSVPKSVMTKRYLAPVVTVGDGTAGADVAVICIAYPKAGESGQAASGPTEFVQVSAS